LHSHHRVTSTADIFTFGKALWWLGLHQIRHDTELEKVSTCFVLTFVLTFVFFLRGFLNGGTCSVKCTPVPQPSFLTAAFVRLAYS
jgi:hypothetical protein